MNLPDDTNQTSLPSASARIIHPALAPQAHPTQDQILEALKDVVDPELGVNIVDLGLVYGVQIDPDGHVTIDMTLTTPMCPLTDQLETDVDYVVSALARDVTINWVWLPPWTMEMISSDGREQLRAIGFNL